MRHRAFTTRPPFLISTEPCWFFKFQCFCAAHDRGGLGKRKGFPLPIPAVGWLCPLLYFLRKLWLGEPRLRAPRVFLTPGPSGARLAAGDVAGGSVPQPDCLIERADGDEAATWAEFARRDLVAVDVKGLPDRLPGRNVPQPDSAVGGTAGDELPIGGDGDAVDRASVPLEWLPHCLAHGGIPQPDSHVVGAACELPAIRAEPHRGHPAAVPFKRLPHTLAVGSAPQAELAVVGATGDEATVGAPGDGAHQLLVSLQRAADLGVRLGVPQQHPSVPGP
mmetsp:Transcript_33213/g.94096  ORF Transcript_33213/g.94096 Transcript_33213/m.94096 type:complete len:278 (+) Transcript_33213:357-1190(+)